VRTPLLFGTLAVAACIAACTLAERDAPRPDLLASVQQALAPEACFGSCAAGQKLCIPHQFAPASGYMGFKACVSVDDPRYGCDPSSCDTKACPATVAHAVGRSTCAAGICNFGGPAPACRAGWGNCDGDWSNGCETNLTTAAACGACGNACTAGLVCEGGACVAACTPPNEDCGNGACQDLATSVTACGCNVCGDGNKTPACAAGKCQAGLCDPGLVPCSSGSGCCDLSSDPNSCGVANHKCPVGTGYGSTNLFSATSYSTCQAGACTATCAPGYSACGTACVDLRGDPAQCGACGAACGAGSTCLGGGCVPAASLQIATGFTTLGQIASDAKNLYVVDRGAPGKIWQIDKTTFAKTQLASGLSLAPPRGIAIDDAYVYWSTASDVRRVPMVGGGAVETLYTSSSGAGVAVDGASVYWSDTGGTYMAPKAGGGAPALVQAGFRMPLDGYAKKASELRIAGGHLYGLNIGTNSAYGSVVWEMDTTTLQVRLRATAPSLAAAGLAADDTRVWYGDYDGRFGGLLRWDPTSAAVVIPSTTGNIVAAGGCGIAYFTAGGGVWKLAAHPSTLIDYGTAAIAIARNVGATGIAIDDTYVYWTAGTNVGRAPREPVIVVPTDAGAADASADGASADADATTDAAGSSSGSSGSSSGSSGSSSGGSTSSSGSGSPGSPAADPGGCTTSPDSRGSGAAGALALLCVAAALGRRRYGPGGALSSTGAAATTSSGSPPRNNLRYCSATSDTSKHSARSSARFL
jgi:hypothetical protein